MNAAPGAKGSAGCRSTVKPRGCNPWGTIANPFAPTPPGVATPGLDPTLSSGAWMGAACLSRLTQPGNGHSSSRVALRHARPPGTPAPPPPPPGRRPRVVSTTQCAHSRYSAASRAATTCAISSRPPTPERRPPLGRARVAGDPLVQRVHFRLQPHDHAGLAQSFAVVRMKDHPPPVAITVRSRTHRSRNTSSPMRERLARPGRQRSPESTARRAAPGQRRRRATSNPALWASRAATAWSCRCRGPTRMTR